MDRATAIDKIRKMLRTAQSAGDTPQGRTARAIAERWMKDHGITPADVKASERQEDRDSVDLADDLGELCRSYTARCGGDPSKLAQALEAAVPELVRTEFLRVRGVYAGRYGRRPEFAETPARVHMDVYTDTFLWGVESAWITTLLGVDRTVDDACAAAGEPPQLPVAIASLLVGLNGPMTANNRVGWQRYHVVNGWNAGREVLLRHGVKVQGAAVSPMIAPGPAGLIGAKEH